MRSSRFPDLARSFSVLFENAGHQDDRAVEAHDVHKGGLGNGVAHADAEPEDEFDWDSIM